MSTVSKIEKITQNVAQIYVTLEETKQSLSNKGVNLPENFGLLDIPSAIDSIEGGDLEAEYDKGYANGYEIGKTEGEELGYSRGYDKGYDLGELHGRAEGYDAGYEMGIKERTYETWIITLTDGTTIEKEVALL